MIKQKKLIYCFGNGKAEGNATMRDLLGGKGAGLHEMTRIGVPVPPGFTIPLRSAPTTTQISDSIPKD